ncbi:hypothetical protein ACJX0J_020405, partial [Zea mays]
VTSYSYDYGQFFYTMRFVSNYKLTSTADCGSEYLIAKQDPLNFHRDINMTRGVLRNLHGSFGQHNLVPNLVIEENARFGFGFRAFSFFSFLFNPSLCCLKDSLVACLLPISLGYIFSHKWHAV